MNSSKTVTSPSLGWGGASAEAQAAVPHVVIAWSRDEPHRIGEAAPVEGPRVLGRGDPQPGDSAPRAMFFQQRPNGQVRQPPLDGSRLSRVQLILSPTADGRLGFKCVGRCPLQHNGVDAAAGVAVEGDVLTLHNALVLFVVVRRPDLCDLRTPRSAPPFTFGGPDSDGIVGESPTAWALRDALTFVAQSSGHVLICGESGVGKELAARALHQRSSRRGRAFVARNAATFPEGLIDAELFGTSRGYPNAGTPERAGLIAEADGGTLFLDEVGELPAQLQSHLLRVLDGDGEYQRLGESRTRRADLRVIAATNRPLTALKHDFCARFALRVEVPGLPSRREDTPLLFRHLIRSAASTTPAIHDRFLEQRPGGTSEPRIAPQLIEALLAHRFTHHLRELERLMWLGFSTSPEPFLALTPQVLAEMRSSAAADESSEAEVDIRDLDRAEIEGALAKARGSVTAAARLLGLRNRFVLHRLLKRYGIGRPADDPG